MRPSILTVAALTLCLTACSNAPQQPSDVVDDRSDQSPYGVSEEEEDRVGDFATPDARPDISAENDVSSSTASLPPVPPSSEAQDASRVPDIAAIAGRWAPTVTECAQDDAVLAVSAEQLVRPGRVCEISDLIDAGENSVTAAMQCDGGREGVEDRELLRLSRDGDTLTFNIVGSSTPPSTFVRCDP